MDLRVNTPNAHRAWPPVVLGAVLALNEGLVLAGHARLTALYQDSVVGIALLGVAATWGRVPALAACAAAVAYRAATLPPLPPPPTLVPHPVALIATLAATYVGAILVVDHHVRRTREQQARLEEAQALAGVGSWEWDFARDRITLTREAHRLFALPEGEPVTLAAAFARIHPEDLPPVRAAVEAARATGRPFAVTYRVVEPDGTRDFDATGRVTLGAGGRPVRMAGTIQDVTARLEAERTIRLSHERLVALDRMKDDFVSAVSHELRTPLTAVKGYLEFLADEIGGPLSAAQHGYVGHARAGAARLERLVDDLLDFALLEAGEFRLQTTVVDVGAVARRVLGMLGAQAAERRIRVDLEEAGTRLATADEARLEQVLINLVGNALKFTPEEGRIAVRIATVDQGVRVEVTDTGPGLPPEAQERLFDKFYRLRRTGDVVSGTGLGLAIAKRLVEAHGGVIGVISAPGAGSTFWFTLPRAVVAEPEPVPASAA